MRLRAAIPLLLLIESIAAQPPTPTPPRLTLTTANHQNTFHIGERIPITFNFTGPENGSFSVSLYRVNRVAGMPFDDISAEPNEGVRDPLAQYLAYSGGGFSGPNPHPALSTKPITRTADLNEWLRFDQPGTYTITAISHRVARKGPPSLFADPEDAFRLKSEPLVLHIIPATPEWQKNTLKQALKALAAPQQTDSDKPDPRDAALVDVRYLGTPEAIALLASQLREDQSNGQRIAMEGLIGLAAAPRELALADLRRLLDDPHFPISSEFLETIAWLQLEELPLPDFDHFDEAEWRRLSTDFHARQQPLLDAAWESAALALPHKVEPARAATARTLSESMPAQPIGTAAAELGAILRASFLKLSSYEQYQALENRWTLLRSSELLPYLRLLAEADNKPDAGFPADPGNLRAIAFERWYEFEPEAATRAIVDQISGPSPTLSAKHLSFLPSDTSFPQLEPVWAKALADDDEEGSGSTLGSLLIRFGTGQAVPRMLTVANRSDNNLHRDVALAYLVRFAPDSARSILIPGRVGEDQCLRTPLAAIVQMLPDPTKQPVVVEAAIQQLTSSCANDVQNAATFLKDYGDDSARKPLLDRYLDWSKRWSGVPEKQLTREDFDGNFKAYMAQMAEQADHDLGLTLAEALLTNLAWMPDAALTADVVDHCAGKNMCSDIRRLASRDLEIAAIVSEDWTYYEVGVFSCPTIALFEAKLDQFPPGTTFTTSPRSTQDTDDTRTFYAGLPALLEKHGMHLAQPK